MSDFTASNGIPVMLTDDGRLIVENADGTCTATVAAGAHVQALREFFRAEEDERLGRWRWPENPDYVVYSRDARGLEGLLVVDERDGYEREFESRLSAEHVPGSIPAQVAVAYFDAHPEPKPWHAARAGQVWDVDLDSGGMRAVTITSANYAEPTTVFRDAHTQVEVEITDPFIRDARRVWPEDAS